MIELPHRKYLVDSSRLPPLESPVSITTGFLGEVNLVMGLLVEVDPVIRVQITNYSKAVLTFEGRSYLGTSLSKELDPTKAREMIQWWSRGTLTRIRYSLQWGGCTWHVFELGGHLKGLWMADVANYKGETTPPWITTEVTGDRHWDEVQLAICRPLV